MLEVQTVAILSHRHVAGSNSCFINEPPRWWCIPTLEVQPYTGGTNSCFLIQLPRVEVQQTAGF